MVPELSQELWSHRWDDVVHPLTCLGGLQIRGSCATRGAVTVRVLPETLEAVTRTLGDTAGVRLADMFAVNGSPVTTLRLVWAHDCGYLVVETETETEFDLKGGDYPPLSSVVPAAFIEECEIYQQFGISTATSGQTPHTVDGHAFESPFGPVRPGGVKSLYYRLVTSGEEAVDRYLVTWHKHRGLERRLRGKTPHEAALLAGRAEGLSAVAVAWAFSAAVESALGIVPPPATARTRAVALELERLYNHAAALAALGEASGLPAAQAAAEIALERLLRVNAAAFGHRYLSGVIEPGGVSRAPAAGLLHRALPSAYDELRRAADALLNTGSFVDRLEACGIVTAEQARRLGLVGPVARATGLPVDARRTGPYDEVPVTIVTAKAGSTLARFNVMLGEAAESIRLINAFLDVGIGADRTRLPAKGDGEVREGMGLGWAESSRGEALAWVALDEDGRIARTRLRPGSARNWRGFDDACRSRNVFADIPIIEASFSAPVRTGFSC